MICHVKQEIYVHDLFDYAERQRITQTLAVRHSGIIRRYVISPFQAAVIAEMFATESSLYL
jgi:hypothetical protein